MASRPATPSNRPATPQNRPAAPSNRPGAPSNQPAGGSGPPPGPSLPGSPIVWARSHVGVTVDGSNNVTALADQSGTGNHANAISATAPTVVAAALDGVAAIQHSANTVYIGRSGLVGGAPGVARTYLMVVNIAALGIFRVLAMGDPAVGSGSQTRVSTNGSQWDLFAGTAAVGGTAVTGWQCVIGRFNGDGTGDLWVDGVAQLSGVPVGTNDDDGWAAGRPTGALAPNSQWAERITWAGALSAAEVTQAFEYMKSLYPSLPALP
jgi:hypothetical protein